MRTISTWIAMCAINSSSEESSDKEEVLRDFENEANTIIHEEIVPKKSADRYALVYETFVKWKNSNKADSLEENVLICYFKDLQQKVNPATLWSIFSMLKKMINIKHNLDINRYLNLKAILKNNSKGYKAKKSMAFTWDEIMKFLNDADDRFYLGTKVLLIFGICGALRCIEFSLLKCSDVQDKNDQFIVSVKDTKTYIDRCFVIGQVFYSKVKEYISLRPPGELTDRFFIQFMNGKCSRQVTGKNKIGSTPAVIATFLNLENPSRYTGHCFRRTSATLLSNSGANMIMLKQLGGWRSDSVAAGYVANSMKSKTLIFEGITHEIQHEIIENPGPSTSNQSPKNQKSEMNEVTQLDLRYEDFIDSDEEKQETDVNFKSGKGEPIPPVLMTNSVNKVVHKRFTSKSPVKLNFARQKKRPRTEDENPCVLASDEVKKKTDSENSHITFLSKLYS